MSNQIFQDIMDQFNQDEDEEKEEDESSQQSEEIKKHKKSSSLTESANNQIKEKFFNTNREIVKKNPNKKRKRDEFGYFVNDDENSNNEEENEEKSDSNENKDEDNINNSSQKKEEEEIENENEEEVNNSIKDNEEEERENNEDNNNNDENHVDNVNDGEFQEKENEQNNNDDNYNDNDNNVNNEEIKENEEEKNVEKIDDKKEESNIDEINKEKTNEENDLINELYNKPKTDNFEQPEVELFRMGSFRPNPVPGSPKFSKRISKNEELLIEKIDKNNNNNVNNNLDNFTETIETKIEGDKHNAQNPEKNQANKTIPIYTHNNDIISLGKIPPVKIINNNNNELLNQKVKEETQSKSNENEEKAEEDFLKREELKIQKNKENTEKKEDKEENKNVKEINIKKDEEEGKENVTEDEEEETKNKKINSNSKDTEQNENNQIERKESGKENNNGIYSAKNSINNENNIKRSNNNDIEEIKVKDLSIKLLTQYQKEGNSMTSSAEHSHQNSGLKNNNIINNNTNRNMGVNRNIYSKKIADRNNNKNNKKIINHQVNQKRAIYESPSDKNFVKKDINYSIDQNQVLSSNQKISPFNYNNVSNFSKKLNTQKKQELQNIKKNLNNINNDQRANSYEKVNKNSEEKYSFKPQINENSRKMYEKKLSNFNKNINNNNNQPGQQKQTTRSELLLLYEDANVIQNKINKEYIKQNNEIISKANKKKINDNSYNMVNNRLNKRIDNAINKFQNNLKLNIVNLTQCLYELNIINELIKPKDNVQDININNQIDLAELQAMVESVKDNDIKKSEEVELIEQLWYLLNPKLEQNFNCEILSIFLKLFFCDNYTQKELEIYIKSLLDNYKINNAEKTEEYKSPLRNKTYDKTGIWSLHQFIKVFLNLKKNLKAYRENDYTKGDLYYNIIKEKDKELTFEPDFEKTNKYFYKYSNFQYNKDNSIIDLINKYSKKNKQKHDFNKVYERFKAEKERHEKTLQRIREIEEEKELKMCTNVPKINKYKPPTRSPIKNQLKENNEILNTEEKLQKNKSFIKQPRYKLLYDLRKKYEKNPKENRIDKDDILDQNCTFKPKITDMDIMNKTFSNIKKSKKPKGFNDYVNRNRSLLEKKEHEKKLEEDKRYGRGYDKLQKMKIKPLNITFSNKSASKPKKNNDYINNTETKRKNRYNLENDKIENIIDNIYITMDIKVSIGVIKPLKIYNKPDKDIIDYISNFCKIYSLNEETKKILIKKALKLKYSFFGKNIGNNRNKIIMGEDLDTITNTYSNEGII